MHRSINRAAANSATFCHFAGVSPADTRAAKAGLPPVDSFSLAPILLGTSKLSPRKELALGNPINGGPHMGGFVGGLIQWPWKRKCSGPLRRLSQT